MLFLKYFIVLIFACSSFTQTLPLKFDDISIYRGTIDSAENLYFQAFSNKQPSDFSIVLSSDAGKTWVRRLSKKSTIPKYFSYQMYSDQNDNIYTSGFKLLSEHKSYGVTYRSSDQGNNWQIFDSLKSKYLTSHFMLGVNKDRAHYKCGSFTNKFKSVFWLARASFDNGKSWRNIDEFEGTVKPNNTNCTGISVDQNNIIYTSGWWTSPINNKFSGVIRVSRNRGRTFTNAYIDNSSEFYKILSTPNGTYAIGQSRQNGKSICLVKMTSDEGRNWKDVFRYQIEAQSCVIQDIAFENDILVISGDVIATSNNDGRKWNILEVTRNNSDFSKSPFSVLLFQNRIFTAVNTFKKPKNYVVIKEVK